MESRLRKLELAGFSSALIGNVCPKQGFRKVTSTASASSSIGVRRAARCSPAHPHLWNSLGRAVGCTWIPQAGNSVYKSKHPRRNQPPALSSFNFLGRAEPALSCPQTTRLLCPCPAASSCLLPFPTSQPEGQVNPNLCPHNPGPCAGKSSTEAAGEEWMLAQHFQAGLPKACTSPAAIPGAQSQDVAHLCSVSSPRPEMPESQSFIFKHMGLGMPAAGMSPGVWYCQD